MYSWFKFGFRSVLFTISRLLLIGNTVIGKENMVFIWHKRSMKKYSETCSIKVKNPKWATSNGPRLPLAHRECNAALHLLIRTFYHGFVCCCCCYVNLCCLKILSGNLFYYKRPIKCTIRRTLMGPMSNSEYIASVFFNSCKKDLKETTLCIFKNIVI